MKQKVQLFINNEEVDVFEDGSINIISSIKDLRDPGLLFADYSRNFNLPATSRNNKVFRHYYDFDIVDGFDARKSVEARIEINSRPYKSGYINLEGVDLKYNKASVYRIIFFGNLRFLKETFNKVKLTSLSWLNNFNFTYKAYDSTGTDSAFHYLTSSIDKTVNSISYTQPIVIPLISNTQRLYYNNSDDFYGQLEDGNLYYSDQSPDVYPKGGNYNGVDWTGLAPAIRVDLIIKAIQDYVNASPEGEDRAVSPYKIQFSNDFFNSANLDYYNLYMWLNKDISTDSTKKIRTTINTFPIKRATSNLYQSQTSTRLLTVDFFSPNGETSGNVASQISITGIQNDFADSVEIRLRLLTSQTGVNFNVILNRDGRKEKTFNNLSPSDGSTGIEYNAELDGVYEFVIERTESTSLTFDNGFEISIVPRVEEDYNIDVVNENGGLLQLFTEKQFFATEWLPDMTILEFLTGLFKMFNLVAEVEDTSPTLKTISIKTLDGFYNSSNTTLDITDKIDISSSKVDRPLNYTKIQFRYKDTDALLAKQHKDDLKSVWGGELYEDTTARSGDTIEIVPPFGHMKFERLINENTDTTSAIQVGHSITRSNRDATDFSEEKYNPYYGDPVMFYPILITGGEEIPYVYRNPADLSTFTNQTSTSYFIPSNTTDLGLSQTNHFGLEANEYDVGVSGEEYEDNLFNTYWKSYISSLFSLKNRFIKLNAKLTNAFISKYSLADKITISNKDYSINKINVNLINGHSELELIPYYAVKSFYCLVTRFTVRVSSTSSGFLYVFDDKYGIFQLGQATYVFEDVPSGHPIAFHNNGKESSISYTGTTSVGTKTGLDGNTYEFFWGDVTVTVAGDFGTVSYECYNHGYMGGENNLQYNAACIAGSSPITEGPLTTDQTTVLVDSTVITSDQTED